MTVFMPVARDFVVTSPFGPRWGTTHWGTDFGLAGGSGGHPVYAVKDGTVTRAGPASGFGRWVTIDHPASNGGGETVYGHIVPEVTPGQRVLGGQRIGRIDPNQATNGNVAPHLHLEWHQYVWSPPGPARLDPMTKLAGAAWPGEEKESDSMATFAVDVSNHQDGFALRHAKAAGAEAVIIKATEGHTFRDPVFHSHLKDARDNGMIVAAYLYVWHNSTPAQMAETFARHVNDTSIPVILDVENNSGRSVTQWRETIAELAKRGYHSPLIYIPHWYWTQIGRPDLSGLPPLWTSNYPAGGGDMKATYARAGGHNGPGWAGYGGLNVELWQFTDQAQIGGRHIDANAYRGTREELDALLSGGHNPPPTPEPEKEVPAMGTTLDTRFPGFVDPEIDGTIADWCRHADRNSFNTLVEIRALRAEVAALRQEIKEGR